jgi:predicted extracellular nuclease
MSHAQLRSVRFVFMSAAAALATAPSAARAQALSLTGGTYTQSFDSLASSGTSSLTPAGWKSLETGTNANSTYTAGTGSSNTGDTYSFGAAGSSERAFGTLRSGSLSPLIGASFTNDTGATITSLTISYAGEQWRLGTSGRADRLDFQYSTSATSLSSSGAGVWIDVDALDFSSPVTTGTVGLLNGNVNRTGLSAKITGLSLAPGATFWIRWVDFDAAGADDGLAIDDFSLTPGLVDAAPSVSAVVPVDGAADVALDANIEVLFSEPVSVDASSFSIHCAVSGDHTFVLVDSGDDMTYTLNPDEDFDIAEECTVTVLAAGVHDKDSNDPPDTMTANFSTGFETTSPCGGAATFIHDIQGSGLASPMVGSIATIEGVVVGAYQAPGEFGGFHVQEEDSDADGDPATSEGIFVFSSVPVHVGDQVRVKGTVAEFSNLTELNNVSSVKICGSGYSVTPTLVTLPVASLSDWERYEGMLVHIGQELTVSENFTLGRFGETTLSVNGRLYTPTAIVAPGAPALAQQDKNDRSRIVLDDGNNQQNIDPTRVPAGGLSASNTLRSGYTVHGLTGVLEERFGVYRIQPVPGSPVSFDASTNPRQSAPAPVGGLIKVASMNVLNFFNGDGQGGGFPTARGANSYDEYVRQRAKMISAILAMDADIAGLMEVENDATDGHSAIEDIVAGLNDALGPGTYEFIDTGILGGDLIRSAIIYRPDTVTPVGDFAFLDESKDPRFKDRGNRPSLAQTFLVNANLSKLTVVVNHLRSKGSSCDSDTSPFNDPDTGDGQGNCNLTRLNAVKAIVDWLATDPTGSNDADFLIVGDMNSYAQEDPIAWFVASGYTNLIARRIGAGAYSYVFDAESGYIDHTLASSHLVDQVAGVSEYHNNADEPVVLDYNFEFKTANQISLFYAPDAFRASDHDPVEVGLDLENAPPTASAGGPYTVDEGGSVTLTATGSDPDGFPDDTRVAFAWDLDGDGIFETAGPEASYLAVDGPATKVVQVKVTDETGLATVASAIVTIHNVAPTLGPISASATLVAVGTPVTASAAFADPGVLDTHVALWSWGDGLSDAGTVSESSGSGTVAGTQVYATAGVYTVTLTVTDKDGGSAQQSFQYLVVYDPNGGFVTGGGWIDSPAGAYVPDPTLAGPASFGFVAKYQKGANVPVGNTELHFHAAGLSFHSTAYQWLVVSGSMAQFKGVGALNGQDGYGFLITAGDGSPDTFRIKIWWSDAAGDHDVYDTGTQPLAGGSIVVKR